MLRSACRIGGLVLALAALPRVVHAIPVVVDFEAAAEGFLTDQIPGLSFTNAFVLTSGAVGGLLNEFEFPPQSGVNVVSDDLGPLEISFTSLVYNLSGYFWYNTALTLTAFDAAGEIIGSVSSALTSHFGSDDPLALAELLGFSSAVGISSIIIAGDPGGFSFTLDDFTYDTDPASGGPPPSHSVPEPATLTMFLLGGAGLFASRRRAKLAP